MRILPWIFRRRVVAGSLTMTAADGFAETFTGTRPGPTVAIHVGDPALDRRMLLNPELAFAEGYMDGGIEITSGTLRDLMALLFVNRAEMGRGPLIAFWRRLYRAAIRLGGGNSLLSARRNAAAHYDIGNDLYRLFLDADMQYSCAYFPTGAETLEQAQTAKKNHVAAKLCLMPGQRVLDIGCGWGGLALHLAGVAEVEVLGVTLAREQLVVARQRAAKAGLADRVRFEFMDYRDLTEQFDRVVSVGMMEHVGAANLPTFFASVHDRLTPDGVALIHSIMNMDGPSYTGPFVRKYIFPGGYSPAASETIAAVEKSGMWLLDFEVWRKHYAFTLREWGRRFAANRDRAKALRGERFCRMWELYLAGAEASFLHDTLAVMQLQLGRRRDAVPLSRDYITAEEARVAAAVRELAA